MINFERTSFSEEYPPLIDFLLTNRTFPNLNFYQVEFGNSDKFWQLLGDTVQEISFKNCDIRERKLISILSYLTNLKTLRIQACRELLMSGRLFETEEDKELLGDALKNVVNLSLANNRYLSDALLNRIFSVIPNLEQLDLSGCHISFHKGLYRKFYPATGSLEPSESVLTFLHISSYIEKQAEKIKYLNFSSTLIDGSALETLAAIEQLRLECITLQQCDQLTNPGVIKLVQLQDSLQSLDLSFSVRITDQCVMQITESLPNIKTLKLRRCRAITDLSVKEMAKLTQLKILDISECETITGQGIMTGLAGAVHTNLRELYVSALNICEQTVIKISEAFPNLTVLDLSCCLNSVSDLCLQMIFRNLIWLRHLNLEMCERISDAGMTGAGMADQIQKHFDKNNETVQLTKDELLRAHIDANEAESPLEVIERALYGRMQDYYKISLGSKAEDEIKSDAMRKQAMREICELNVSENKLSGHSVTGLKGLRVLKLSGCIKVSDVSLKYCFKFPELKQLSLARCQQITIEGIDALVQNCPSIEVLDLSECHNISDKAIELVTKKLNRLTSLTLERCIQLTDFTLDYILINCKHLRVSCIY